MSELIGGLEEGGSPLRVPEEWVAGERAVAAGPDSGIVAALVVSAMSGALVGAGLGFVLAWLLV